MSIRNITTTLALCLLAALDAQAKIENFHDEAVFGKNVFIFSL